MSLIPLHETLHERNLAAAHLKKVCGQSDRGITQNTFFIYHLRIKRGFNWT